MERVPQAIRQAVQKYCPGAGSVMNCCRIATGKWNESFFVHCRTEDLVVRVAPPDDEVFLFYERKMIRQEPAIHKLLLEETAVPVPTVLHMDVWHQNILVGETGETVTGLLDWDRALWGDPEIEFAVLDYCGISTPAFWQGYSRTRDVSRSAQVRRVFYLLYELQKYIVIRAGRNGDRRSAADYVKRSRQLVRHLSDLR